MDQNESPGQAAGEGVMLVVCKATANIPSISAIGSFRYDWLPSPADYFREQDLTLVGGGEWKSAAQDNSKAEEMSYDRE